jgi:murein DD-endopeptidase MepM/ murein hydrolase activator NlpD
VSSRSYRGRHYAGRHRVHSRGVRLPRALSSSFVLPTVAAAALVVTATAATAAESTPVTLDLTGQQSAMARTQQASDEELVTDLASRRQDAQIQTAAVQGRAEAQARAARDAKRKAEAAAKAKAKAEREAKKWVRPIGKWHLTSGYGSRWGRLHAGLDLAAPIGTPLYAMSSGRVVKTSYSSGRGNMVEIQHWDGSVVVYAHMSRIDVHGGQALRPGQVVGAVGNTGHSYGPHLHLEVHSNPNSYSPINPVPLLQKRGLW